MSAGEPRVSCRRRHPCHVCNLSNVLPAEFFGLTLRAFERLDLGGVLAFTPRYLHLHFLDEGVETRLCQLSFREVDLQLNCKLRVDIMLL